jgi:FlaA1/EpsC-like NDP-sugar epimerase
VISQGAIVFNKIYSRLPVLIYDTVCIFFAWCGAFYLRYNLEGLASPILSKHALSTFLLLFSVQLICYYYFKIYRGLWRFSSLNDVLRIMQSILSATVATLILIYAFSFWGDGVSRAVLALYDTLLMTLLCGARLLFRYKMDNQDYVVNKNLAQKVLVIGAGQAGAGLIRELKRSTQYFAVGLVDDNLSKSSHEVHGVLVLGRISDLPKLVLKYNIDLIFIAIPSATSAEMRKILMYCEKTGLPTRTLPGLSDIVEGRVSLDGLRNVNLEDLLGREQVTINKDSVAQLIQDKRILVTGGGGSIGSELCRQICMFKPERLIIIDHDEYNLYSIDRELSKSYPTIKLDLILLSVTNVAALRATFKRYRPEIVLHAAAYKHVPLLESQLCVAAHNNIIGTNIVAQASVDFAVQKFILISTDKAVNPTNVMGATKRAAELICQNWNLSVKTQFITVRFGNVLGSIGSVVPLFQQQLQQGGPLTVTHPDIERYFMTIPEASLLILQAMSNGNGGEIFVLDMGEPVKISYLAEQMIRLSGKQPGKDIMIEYTGLRPGEKLFEELFHDAEELLKTEHQKLFKAKTRNINWHELMQTINMMQDACFNQDDQELMVLLKSIVPEFQCSVNSSEIIDESLIER